MNVAFLFPGGAPYEALDNWVLTISRFAKRHKITLARMPVDCVNADYVFLLTECRTYPRHKIDMNIASLRRLKIPFGVVHNNDNAGEPIAGDDKLTEQRFLVSPGNYPSFVWTERAYKLLAEYRPMFCRQPILPPIMPEKQRALHIGTFGHIEPKKCTLEMATWAHRHELPFTAFCPEPHPGWCPDRKRLWKEYGNEVTGAGGNLFVYEWRDKVEELAETMDCVSHFLFVLPPSKGGAGGSPTSPRFATAFARPVLVVDDELTLCNDGIQVFSSLDRIGSLDALLAPEPPYRGPDEYIDELIIHTDWWWGNK
jgi:hypothetical protein